MISTDILQALLSNTEDLSGKTNAKIQHLKEAKSKLDRQINDYETLAQALTSIKSSTSHSAFKGTRREKFDSNMQQMTSALKSEVSKHQDASQKIEAKIRNMEAQADNMNRQVSDLIEEISKLSTD